MGGFFSVEHHPIYDDRDIENLKGLLHRFRIVKEDGDNDNKAVTRPIKNITNPRLFQG